LTGYVFTAALRDSLRPGRMIAWALVAFVILLIAIVWHRVAQSLTPLEAYGQVVDIVVFRMLALAAAVTSTSVVTQEVEQKTIVYLLTRSQPRAWILLCRVLAATVTATIISWMALFAAGIPTLGANLLSSSAFRTDLVILAVGALAYVSLFTFVSLIINKALIVCLLYAFGWETFVQNMTGGMSRLSLSGYLSTLANHAAIASKGPVAFLSGDLGADKPAAWVCWIVLLAVGIMLAGAGALWFQNNEYVAREDAE
jgi:ABC-2 type transport system permease protein